MKQLQILLLSAFFIFSSISPAYSYFKKKFAFAEIHLKSGDKIDCVVQMPIYVRKSKITYKADWKTDKKTKIDADEIDLLILKNTSGRFVLKWTKYYKKGSKKISRYEAWLELRSVCPEVSTYVIVENYKKSDYGEVHSYYSQGIAEHLIQRRGEEYPTAVGHVFIRKSIMKKTADKKRRKLLKLYFQDDDNTLAWLEPKKRVDQAELTNYLKTLCKTEESE